MIAYAAGGDSTASITYVGEGVLVKEQVTTKFITRIYSGVKANETMTVKWFNSVVGIY